MNELEVKVENLEAKTIPPVKWNEAEVSAILDDMLSAYTGRVYTSEEIKDAKKDRAAVNNIEKQLAMMEKMVKDFYAAPVKEFTAKMKQFRQKCKDCSTAIDTQVKAVEDAEKGQKQERLEAVYKDVIGSTAELIPFEKLFNPKWLNKSATYSTCEAELIEAIQEKKVELDQLAEICHEGAEYSNCLRVYLQNLSMKEAIAERQSFRTLEAKRKKMEEGKTQEEPVNPEIVRKATANVQMAQVVDENGRLDFSKLREEKVFDRTLHIRYTAEQGKRLIVALNEIGIQYELN